MDALLVLILLLVIFAIAGGVWISHFIFIVLVVALIVFLVRGRRSRV